MKVIQCSQCGASDLMQKISHRVYECEYCGAKFNAEDHREPLERRVYEQSPPERRPHIHLMASTLCVEPGGPTSWAGPEGINVKPIYSLAQEAADISLKERAKRSWKRALKKS